MPHYSKNNLITFVLSLPLNDIGAFILLNKNHIDKLAPDEMNEFIDTVFNKLDCDKDSQVDTIMASMINWFGAPALAARFAALMKRVDDKDTLTFIEKHANEMSEMFTPPQLLEFFSTILPKILLPYSEFSIPELISGLSDYSNPTDDGGGKHSLFKKLSKIGVAELRAMSADQLIEACRSHVHRTDSNTLTITSYKKCLDQCALDTALANLKILQKLIELFASTFSKIESPATVVHFLKSLKSFDKTINDNLFNCDKSAFFLTYQFVFAMHQAISNGDAMEAVIKYINPESRLHFFREQDKYLAQKEKNVSEPEQKAAKRNSIFAKDAQAAPASIYPQLPSLVK